MEDYVIQVISTPVSMFFSGCFTLAGCAVGANLSRKG